MGLKSNVLATLSSPQVKWINFAFANRMLSPVMYRSLYGLVDGGTIKCEVDSSLDDTAMYDPANNKLVASDGSYRIERCVCAVDVGRPINRLGLEAQMTGGTIDGISTARNL